MIPKSNIDDKVFQERLREYEGKKYNSYDYRLGPNNTIVGYVDGPDAVAQAARFILSTERFQYVSMSDDTGVELGELYGDNSDMLIIQLKNRISDALLYDNRIESIENLTIEHVKRGRYLVSLDILTNEGEQVRLENEVISIDNN